MGCLRTQLRLRAHESDELSHYSSATSDVEFLFPWGWDEFEGIANRGDFDLTQHAEHSGEKPRVVRPGGERALGPPRDRTCRRGDPHCDGLPDGRVRRGGGAGREAGGAAVPPEHRPLQGGRAAAVQEARALWPGLGAGRAAANAASCATTTRPRRSAAATAARTRSARPTASPTTSTPSRTHAVTVRDRDTMEQDASTGGRGGRTTSPSAWPDCTEADGARVLSIGADRGAGHPTRLQ